jgi:hypothetical protein
MYKVYVRKMYKIYVRKIKKLVKNIEEELNKWRDIPWLWTGRLILSRCQFFQN